MTARALWFESAGRAHIRTEALPDPPDGWRHITTAASAVSPGTERLVATGRVPAPVYDAMRCLYMEGSFAFPLKYGYSLVGRLDDGRLAHVMHPHQTECNVRMADVRLVPDGIPPERATLAPNLETAVNALWDAELSLGERILVIGFGAVGSLMARLLSITNASFDIVDTDPAKRELARSMGFNAVAETGGEYDVAIGASGNPAEVQLAIDAVGIEGRIVEVSWLGSQEARVDLGGSFHSGRKRIIGSQVSRIPPRLRGRWNHARRMELVFALLRDPAFDAHLTSSISFDELPRFYDDLCAGRVGGLSVVVRYA
jgi:threonine dehydrogenase-like Zn-dependent dehydrogenase